jgi:sigma-B regulation protein RsbU (phosphoserine phosphatase)
MSAASLRVLLAAATLEDVADVRPVLEAGSFQVIWHPFGSLDPSVDDVQLVLIQAAQSDDAALRCCRQLHARLRDSLVPVVFLTHQASHVAPLEAGATVCLSSPPGPEELLAQTRALLRFKEAHDRLADKAAEVHRLNRRLQQAHEQIDAELELARRIQLSFLPQALPSVAGVRFAVHYRLCGRVGGDFYDVFRLDEHHIGLYVADAMGHGVPASLLALFVKKGVRPKEISGDHYRLLPPDDVLGRLNRDLVAQAMPDHPFITMIYALYDQRERKLSFARAGHPYPLYVPSGAEPRFWPSEGSLLGVFDTTFPLQSQRLCAGDKVLLYSDGIDGARFEACATGSESLLACAARHRDLPIEEFVLALGRDLFGEGSQPDDLTLLGLELKSIQE